MAPGALALWLTALAAVAAIPFSHAQRGNAEVYRFAVGNISALVANDGPVATAVDFDPSQPDRLGFIANLSLATLNAALADAHRPPDNVTFHVNVLLLEVEGRRVLIDSGTGTGFPGSGRIFDNLAGAGAPAESVDFVVLTHGHPDHYGGLVGQDGELNFPNAAYFVSKAEFEFWTGGEGGDENAATLLRAIENRTTFVEEDGEVLVPGVKAVFTTGHTPGHMSVEVDGGGGAKLLCTADAVFNEVSMARPSWEVAFDIDERAGIETRKRLLERLSGKRERTFVYHMSFPGLGHVNEIPADMENGNEVSYAWVPELYEF